MTYRHTQFGSITLSGLALGTLVAAMAALSAPDGFPRFLAAGFAVLLAFLAALFGTLRVDVDREAVHLRFGFGWLRKDVPLRRIAEAKRVRNRWWYGWGIRLVPGGWMWNVGGLDAVELLLENGRRFRIGTDDPEKLHRAIEAGRGQAASA